MLGQGLGAACEHHPAVHVKSNSHAWVEVTLERLTPAISCGTKSISCSMPGGFVHIWYPPFVIQAFHAFMLVVCEADGDGHIQPRLLMHTSFLMFNVLPVTQECMSTH